MKELSEEELEEINENFDNFDIDNNGLVDFMEFTYLVDSLGGKMDQDEMQKGFKEADTDNDTFINIDEFTDWWCEE